MKIGILGTGDVGETLGKKLVELGHEVKMGSRTANNEKATAFVKKAGAKASAGSFADAAKFGEVIFNCTLGSASVEAVSMAGEANLDGKVLVDVSNPLDFSKGMPPTLFLSNTDSLGETLQRKFPKAKVVKTLNTMWCGLMVNPRMLPESHVVFVAGNDDGAKKTVKGVLAQFGWKDEEMLDLGDITNSRATEALLPIWVRVMGAKRSPAFNFKFVQAK
jgi:predicted dinucleotide-binding enzyme